MTRIRMMPGVSDIAIHENFQRIENELDVNPVIEQVPFAKAGALVLGRSPGWPLRPGPTELYEIDGRLLKVGTTVTTVVLERNLITIVTVTFPANSLVPTPNPVKAVVKCASGDLLTSNITVVGAGAEDLSLSGRLRYPT